MVAVCEVSAELGVPVVVRGGGIGSVCSVCAIFLFFFFNLISESFFVLIVLKSVSFFDILDIAWDMPSFLGIGCCCGVIVLRWVAPAVITSVCIFWVLVICSWSAAIFLSCSALISANFLALSAFILVRALPVSVLVAVLTEFVMNVLSSPGVTLSSLSRIFLIDSAMFFVPMLLLMALALSHASFSSVTFR